MNIPSLLCILCLASVTGVWSQCNDECPNVYTSVDQVQDILTKLARQVILQRLFIEERLRTSVDSGIKQIALNRFGSRSYDAASQTGSGGVAGFYDVADEEAKIGIGDTSVVLNGLEFRTKQGSSQIVKPSTTSDILHAVEDIESPDVPPTVTGTVSEQIAEMKEYFRAFKEQDTTIRNYIPYFKPVICYLEGAYYKDETVEGVTPTFQAASGRDASDGAGAYLPRVLFDYDNVTGLTFGQWGYRVLCQPISNNVNTDAFRVVDDLAARASNTRVPLLDALSPQARFQLSFDGSNWNEDPQLWQDGYTKGPSFINKMMNDCPGLNNNGAALVDDASGLIATEYPDGVNTPATLDASKQNHFFGVLKTGAMNKKARQRGYADQNLHMAMTTQTDVLGLAKNNTMYRYSYSFPLKIIYLTPLPKWNPYGLKKYSSKHNKKSTYRACTSGTHCTAVLSSDNFYQIPAEFLGSEHGWSDPGNSPGECNGVYVLDPSGVSQKVCSAGHQALMNITDVGVIRLDYPTAPLSRDGGADSKEVEVLKDIITYSYRFTNMRQDARFLSGMPNDDSYLYLLLWESAPLSDHPDEEHVIRVTASEVIQIMKGQPLIFKTEPDLTGTIHELQIDFEKLNSDMYRFFYVWCDSPTQSGNQWCRHPRRIDIVANRP